MPSPTSSADGSHPSLNDSPSRKRSMDEESEECGPNKMSKISVAFQCPYCTYSTDKKVTIPNLNIKVLIKVCLNRYSWGARKQGSEYSSWFIRLECISWKVSDNV